MVIFLLEQTHIIKEWHQSEEDPWYNNTVERVRFLEEIDKQYNKEQRKAIENICDDVQELSLFDEDMPSQV